MPRITKRLVDALMINETVFDSDLKGFAVRRQKSEARTFYVRYRTKTGGRQRWLVVGRYGVLTVDQARDKAQPILGAVANGEDPAQHRDNMKDRPTVDDLGKQYLTDHAKPHKKESSVVMDEANLRNHIGPLLGSIAVADVTRSDVAAMMKAIRDGKTAKDEKIGPRKRRIVKGGATTANRNLALLSKMMNLAEAWGWREDNSNPCRHVKKNKERGRERFLSEAEFAQLARAMAAAEKAQQELDDLLDQKASAKTDEDKSHLRDAIRTKAKEAVNPFVLAAIRTLVFTGARLREVLHMRWDQMDLTTGVARLDDSKTGARIIWLPGPVRVLLADLPKIQDGEFVFPSLTTGQPMPDIKGPWKRITESAGLEGLRVHDLRHSHASVGVAGGMSLQLIGSLLGHREIQTTSRFAHLADDPQRRAAEAIASRIQVAMDRKDDDKVAQVIEFGQQSGGG